jgi:3-dehydroquinate dehydratase-1
MRQNNPEFIQAIDRPEPSIAATFSAEPSDELIADVGVKADVAEVRADLYSEQSPQYLAEQLARFGSIPTLLTVRTQKEGGGWQKSEDERLALIDSLIDHVDALDIELKSKIFHEATQLAHEHQVPVIASSHDHKDTPYIFDLDCRTKKAVNGGADFVKLATTTETMEQYLRLSRFLEMTSFPRLVVVGMGEYGPLSRISFPAFGSLMSYAYAGEQPVAPGQLPYDMMHSFFRETYSDYRAMYEEDA